MTFKITHPLQMMKKESFMKGLSFMVLSALGLSLVGMFGKLGMEMFSLTSLIFWRFFAAFAVSLFIFGAAGVFKTEFTHRSIGMHCLRAIFVLGAQYSFYFYIGYHSLLNATALLNTGPLFIPLIEWGVLRNRVGKSTWIGVVVAFIGVLCLLQPNVGVFSWVSLIGVLSGICQGASQVVFGINSKYEKVQIEVLYLFFLCMVLSVIPYFLVGVSGTWIDKRSLGLIAGVLLLIVLGIVSLGSQWARAIAYQYATPSRLSPFFYFSVVFAGAMDWMVFHKVPNLLSIIGAILVIFGGVLKIFLRSSFIKKG